MNTKKDVAASNGRQIIDSRESSGMGAQLAPQPSLVVNAIGALQYFNPDGLLRMGQDEVVEVRTGDQWMRVRECVSLPTSSDIALSSDCGNSSISIQNATDTAESGYRDPPIKSQLENLPNPPQSEGWEDRWLEITQKYRDRLRNLDIDEHYKVLTEAYKEFQKDLLSLKYDLEMGRQ